MQPWIPRQCFQSMVATCCHSPLSLCDINGMPCPCLWPWKPSCESFESRHVNFWPRYTVLSTQILAQKWAVRPGESNTFVVPFLRFLRGSCCRSFVSLEDILPSVEAWHCDNMGKLFPLSMLWTEPPPRGNK